MAMFLKLSFLITCFVMVNCKPRNSYEKTVLHVKVNNDGIVKTVSSSQITTYSSFGSFGGFGVGNVEDALYRFISNMIQNLKFNFPLIQLDPRDLFGPYFNAPQYPLTTSDQTAQRAPNFPTSTKRIQETTSRPTQRPTTLKPVKTTTESNPDDYDDSTRPIVLRDIKSPGDKEIHITSRTLPDVEHGSVQAGRSRSLPEVEHGSMQAGK